MDLSLNYKWIKEYLKTDLSAVEFAKQVTPFGILIEKWKKNEALDDYILESEVTANRADLASVIGIAREASAVLGLEFIKKTVKLPEKTKDLPLKVSISSDLCRRYQALVIDNVTVKESPKWLKDRLEALGFNSINNLVDISNYVLLELGQPTHIFDYEKLSGKEIKVRQADEGEEIETLDMVKKVLSKNDMVIADSLKPIALAGIKGGKATGVSGATKTIVIESANFEPVNIRRTARRNQIYTDASSLFEKNLPEELTWVALDRVAELVLELAGGEIASEIIDEKNFKENECHVVFDTKLVKKIIGVEIEKDQIENILTSLGFGVQSKGEIYEIVVPYFRKRDIQKDYDIVEEIARVYGYENIPGRLLASEIPSTSSDSQIELENNAKTALVNTGYTEIFSRSLVSDRHLEILGTNVESVLKIFNPLNEDFKYMRSELSSSMLIITEENLKYEREMYLFELNQVFLPAEESQLPIEKTNLILCLTGKDKKDMYMELKVDFEKLLFGIGLEIDEIKFENTNGFVFLKTGYKSEIKYKNESIGFIGIVKKNILNTEVDICILEVDFEKIGKYSNTKKKFTPIPTFQDSKRDISFLINQSTTWLEIFKLIKAQKIAFLESFELIDEFKSNSFENQMKSWTIRFVLRSTDFTLSEDLILQTENHLRDLIKDNFEVIFR